MSIRRYQTGACLEQSSLLPPRIEDYVTADNPVRAIEAYVCGLDLEALGFRHADRDGGTGQPPYDPADLLGLYLYGYLNRVRSSRALERETQRNLEVIWLLKGQSPGYRVPGLDPGIGDFRRDNWSALKATNREFVVLLRSLDLVGGERQLSRTDPDASGKRQIRYVSRRSACRACALRNRCLTAKVKQRTIYRWEHEAVIERHRARMAQAAAALMMRRRAELAEHPFGTLKCRAGYRHFLLRGFDKVRGEWSLMALCYNFTRVLSIIGFDRFIACLARYRATAAILLLNAVLPARDRTTTLIARCCASMALYRVGQAKMLQPSH